MLCMCVNSFLLTCMCNSVGALPHRSALDRDDKCFIVTLLWLRHVWCATLRCYFNTTTIIIYCWIKKLLLCYWSENVITVITIYYRCWCMNHTDFYHLCDYSDEVPLTVMIPDTWSASNHHYVFYVNTIWIKYIWRGDALVHYSLECFFFWSSTVFLISNNLQTWIGCKQPQRTRWSVGKIVIRQNFAPVACGRDRMRKWFKSSQAKRNNKPTICLFSSCRGRKQFVCRNFQK